MKNQHVAVIAVVSNEKGEILLIKRNEPTSPHAHGKWLFPGGGIEFGEDPKTTAIREIHEETGVHIKLLAHHPKVFSHVYQDHNIHVILLAYPALYLHGELDTTIDPDKHTDDVDWFAYEDIDFSNALPLTKDILDAMKG